MLQEIAPHHFNNAYQPDRLPQEHDYVIITLNNEVALTQEGRLPGVKDVDTDQLTYLFMIDDQAYYYTDHQALPSQCSYAAIRGMKDSLQMYAAITGVQLARWYQTHQYCGCCAQPMKQDTVERKMICPACGHFVYPHIAPAVIVGVRNGDHLLLSRPAQSQYKFYAMIAGFAEVGEMIEDTVRREVYEEVGLKVKNITYYRSQPWSFSDSLLLGFYCDVDGDPTLTVDQNELSMAVWMPRKEIPLHQDNISLTGEMMKRFKEGKDKDSYQ